MRQATRPRKLDTEDEKKTLVELFDGRSQLLIYHLMFGPSYEAACPGCTGLADHLDAALVHMNNRDVTLMCISRAPIEKLNAYKQRMGWRFPWPSSFASDFNFDFDFAHTEEEMKIGELAREVAEAPDWLEEWADSVGTDLTSGMAESPGWSVFARENGSVYHTYSRTAPDRFLLSPYYAQLLDQVPAGATPTSRSAATTSTEARKGGFPTPRRPEPVGADGCGRRAAIAVPDGGIYDLSREQLPADDGALDERLGRAS